MADRILNEDWSDYDQKKKKYIDRRFFSCDEAWEVDYLVKKIKKYYTSTPESTIRNAIATCCGQVPAPRPREVFVKCVVGRL